MRKANRKQQKKVEKKHTEKENCRDTRQTTNGWNGKHDTNRKNTRKGKQERLMNLKKNICKVRFSESKPFDRRAGGKKKKDIGEG